MHSCRHRLSDSEIEIDVIKKRLVFSNLTYYFGELDLISFSANKMGLQDSPLAIREDVRSHEFSVAGKSINALLDDCVLSSKALQNPDKKNYDIPRKCVRYSK